MILLYFLRRLGTTLWLRSPWIVDARGLEYLSKVRIEDYRRIESISRLPVFHEFCLVEKIKEGNINENWHTLRGKVSDEKAWKRLCPRVFYGSLLKAREGASRGCVKTPASLSKIGGFVEEFFKWTGKVEQTPSGLK